jgi:hypothetical protein
VRRWRIAILVSLALFLLVWLAISRGPGPDRDPAGNAKPPAAGTSPVETPEQSPNDLAIDPPAPEDQTSEANAPEEVSDVDDPDPLLPEVTIEGTLTLIEGDLRFSSENGSLGLIISGPDDSSLSTREQVNVREGRWETTVPSDSRIRVAHVAAGDRTAHLDGSRFLSTRPADPSLDWGVVANWNRSLFLSVRSKETGAPLRNITVIRMEGRQSARPEHPGDSKKWITLVEGDPSPLEIVGAGESHWLSRSVGLHVWSPGYAWTSIDVDLTVGGDREVQLTAEARLEVTIIGEPWPEAVLRIRRSDGASLPSAEFSAEEPGRLDIDSLRGGPVRVSVEVGLWFRMPKVLAEADVELVAGELARVDLDLRGVIEEEGAPLLGTVFVPAGWGDASFQLKFRARSESAREAPAEIRSLSMDRTPRVRGILYSWDAGEVASGNYIVTVAGFGFAESVDVGPAGATIALEIPPPTEVVLFPIDAETGEPVDLPQIFWGSGSGGFERANRDRTSGAIQFLAPEGRIHVIPGQGYHVEDPLIEIGPGRTEVDLLVSREIRIEFRLRDGETPVPIKSGFQVEVESTDGSGKHISTGSYNGERYVTVSGPGRYRLTFSSLEGFLPIAPEEVEVITGETVRVTLALERQP